MRTKNIFLEKRGCNKENVLKTKIIIKLEFFKIVSCRIKEIYRKNSAILNNNITLGESELLKQLLKSSSIYLQQTSLLPVID